MNLIGAVNDKFLSYFDIINRINPKENTVQLGNFGSERRSHSWLNQKVRASNHRMIFGPNDPAEFFTGKHSLGEFGIVPNEKDAFFIANREISTSNWSVVYIKYKAANPKIVLTNEPPQSVREQFTSLTDTTVNSANLQKCLDIHKPETWVFESDKSIDEVIDGVRFVGLIELQVLSI